MLVQTKSTHSITKVRQSQFVFGARARSTASWAARHVMTFFQSSIRTSPSCSVLSRSPKNNGPKGRQCQSCVAGAPTCNERGACAQMTEEQYRGLLLHLRILIVLVGFMVGILLAFALQYL
jgi:hypothetical protein